VEHDLDHIAVVGSVSVDHPVRTHERTVMRELSLQGGPSSMPTIAHVADDVSTHVKIPRLDGYEHYEFLGQYREREQRSVPVFEWTYTTKIAE
jgi:hypothetical protein